MMFFFLYIYNILIRILIEKLKMACGVTIKQYK